MKSDSFLKRHPMWLYLILAFVISWTLWAVLIAITPIDAMQEGVSPSFIILAALGGFGPSVAGIIATAIVDGKAGLRDLWARTKRGRVSIGWYAVALLLTPLVGLATVVVDRLFGLPTATWKSALATLPLSVLWPIFAALGEEYGWRGFMLPRMQKRQTALLATIVVGIAWGVWHLPTQILAFRQYGMGIVLLHLLLDNLLGLLPIAIAMTVVHNSTGKSMLLMLIFHYSVTATAQIYAGPTMGIAEGLWHGVINSVVWWVVAAIIIAWAGAKRLTRGAQS